jgi:hypothetical protein
MASPLEYKGSLRGRSIPPNEGKDDRSQSFQTEMEQILQDLGLKGVMTVS